MSEEITNNHSGEYDSVTPSGFFGAGPENIVAIDDFMTEYELKTLNEYAKTNTLWDKTETRVNDDGIVIYDSGYWDHRVATEPTLKEGNLEVVEIIQEMQLRLKDRVDDFFSVDAHPTSPAIVRWLPGQRQQPHADKELHEGDGRGQPNDFPYYDIAGLFYINDDYEGGELYFPNHGIQFKPKAGSAYFFPGDMNYIHGVTEIRSGIRYVCPFFWTVLEHTGTKQP
jgi:hypothetical protein